MNKKQTTLLMLLALIMGISIFSYKISKIQLGGHEALVATTARETLQGNWIVPQCNGEIRIRKTPLPYWIVALVSKLRGKGIDEISTRIYSVLSAGLLILILGAFSAKIFNHEVGIITAFATASSIGIILQAHRGTADMLLTMLCSASLLSFFYAFSLIKEGKKATLWLHIGYITFGLAMMAKGPVPIAVVGLPVVLYLLYSKLWRRWKDLSLISGLTIAIVLSGWWFVAVYLSLPDAIWRWKLEFVDRFTGQMQDFRGPYYYIPYVFAFALPWSFFLPIGLIVIFKKIYARENPQWKEPLTFILIWLIAVFLFFTLSSGKRPHYILPVIPAVIVLSVIGFIYYIKEIATRKQLILLNILIAVAIISTAIIGWIYIEKEYAGSVSFGLFSTCIAIIAVGYALFDRFYKEKKLIAASFVLAAITISPIGLSLTILPDIMIKTKNPKAAAIKMKEFIQNDEKLYSIGDPDPSIVFYYGKPIRQIPTNEEVLKWLEEKDLQQIDKDFGRIVANKIDKIIRQEKVIYLLAEEKHYDYKEIRECIERYGFVPIAKIEKYRGKKKAIYILTNDPKATNKIITTKASS